MIPLNRRDWLTIAAIVAAIAALSLLPVDGVSKPMPSGWPAFRAANIAKECGACGRTSHLELHHIVPRHIDPTGTFDRNNVFTLCDWCHVVLGHLGDDRTGYNLDLVSDAKAFRERVKYRETGGRKP